MLGCSVNRWLPSNGYQDRWVESVLVSAAQLSDRSSYFVPYNIIRPENIEWFTPKITESIFASEDTDYTNEEFHTMPCFGNRSAVAAASCMYWEAHQRAGVRPRVRRRARSVTWRYILGRAFWLDCSTRAAILGARRKDCEAAEPWETAVNDHQLYNPVAVLARFRVSPYVVMFVLPFLALPRAAFSGVANVFVFKLSIISQSYQRPFQNAISHTDFKLAQVQLPTSTV